MKLDEAVGALAVRYPGPGGAAAVLREGEILARHVWGWRDAERRLVFTADTPFRICSITKQFTCALLRDLFADPGALDDDVRLAMPLLAPAPGVLDLCHNQSGLRDYWALTALLGAPVEGRFDEEDARGLIGGTRTLQFAPGTRYSYANQNFRLLSDIIERRTDRPFRELLRTRVFEPVGMAGASLAAETETLAGGTVGYEGTVGSGFRPAVNRIHWTGDAGVAATLDDMIAWERFIDRTRDSSDGLFGRLTAPVCFRDGSEASYGFGLSRMRLYGEVAFSHGGGLRGWRSFRAYLPGPRVSVVVFFNHMSDARAAALSLLASILPEHRSDATAPKVSGRFVEPETGLAVRIEDGAVLFAAQPETIGNGVSVRVEADRVWMDRPGENMSTQLRRVEGTPEQDIEGTFLSAELGATLTCAAVAEVLYGAFSGALGEGSMQALVPFGPDLWLLPCPRALDYPPPGDWTLAFRRDGTGRVEGVDVGCWLARRIPFVRQA